MQRIWAPWRIRYILGKKEKGCFLCYGRGLSARRTRYVLAESRSAAVLLNKYPYAAAHLLVIPKRHVSSLENLSDEELSDLMMLVRGSSVALRKALQPDGMNIGINLGKAAGAGLEEHLHVHMVPRWNGDHNFMPIVSGTMVISEYLEDTYKRLAPFFKTLGEQR